MQCNRLSLIAFLRGAAPAGQRTPYCHGITEEVGSLPHAGSSGLELETLVDSEYFVGVVWNGEEIAMRLDGAIMVAILLGGTALAGQTAVPPPEAASTITGFTVENGHVKPFAVSVPAFACPVVVHAGHLADGSMVKTDGVHPRGTGQWLSLSLTNSNQKEIQSATLSVRGVIPKGHVTDAGDSKGAALGDAVGTFHLRFVPGPNETSVANLWAPGMSAVERIDLLAVIYSDGSTWRVAAGRSCHVAPDPFMLITSR